VRWSGTVALLTVYLTANFAWFLYSVSSWLDNHSDNRPIDVGHVDMVAWWQIALNGLLLLTLRQTRKVGTALLLSALGLIALVFVVGMLAMREG
jgi:hypothetical protein